MLVELIEYILYNCNIVGRKSGLKRKTMFPEMRVAVGSWKLLSFPTFHTLQDVNNYSSPENQLFNLFPIHINLYIHTIL